MSLLVRFLGVIFIVNNAEYSESHNYHVKLERSVVEPLDIHLTKENPAPVLNFFINTKYGLEKLPVRGRYENTIHRVINPSIPIETITERMKKCFESKETHLIERLIASKAITVEKTGGEIIINDFMRFIAGIDTQCGSLNVNREDEKITYNNYRVSNRFLDIDCPFRVPKLDRQNEQKYMTLYSIINPNEKLNQVNNKLNKCLEDYEKNPNKLTKKIKSKLKLLQECQNSQQIIKQGLIGLCYNENGIFNGKATVNEPKKGELAEKLKTPVKDISKPNNIETKNENTEPKSSESEGKNEKTKKDEKPKTVQKEQNGENKPNKDKDVKGNKNEEPKPPKNKSKDIQSKPDENVNEKKNLNNTTETKKKSSASSFVVQIVFLCTLIVSVAI